MLRMRNEEGGADLGADRPPIVVGLPELRAVDDGWVELAAPIDWRGNNPGLPETAYFRVPQAQAEFLATRSDPFFVFLLMTAMRLGRPLHVRGEVSARTGAGAAEFMRIFAAGYPGRYSVVPVEATWTTAPPERVGKQVVSTFSGGVDSFHTLMRRTRDGIGPAERLTHVLFVAGFDLDPVANGAYYREVAVDYARIAASRGATLLLAETNFRKFSTPLQWLTMHGCGVIACAHALSALVGTFYIPSTLSADLPRWPPWGTDGWTDYLLGSENLQIVHDALEATRTEKIVELAAWDEFLRSARVCLHPPAHGGNCGRCEKCRRTMVHMDIAGCLDRATTFSEEARREAWRHVSWCRPGLSSSAWTVRREALDAGRPDLARRLTWIAVKDAVRRARKRRRGKPRSG